MFTAKRVRVVVSVIRSRTTTKRPFPANSSVPHNRRCKTIRWKNPLLLGVSEVTVGDDVDTQRPRTTTPAPAGVAKSAAYLVIDIRRRRTTTPDPFGCCRRWVVVSGDGAGALRHRGRSGRKFFTRGNSSQLSLLGASWQRHFTSIAASFHQHCSVISSAGWPQSRRPPSPTRPRR